MHRFAFLLALGGAFLGTSTASAQGWLADRAAAQGPGFRVGNLELHPGIGIEGGYDSNVFFEDTDTDSSAIMRVTAHLLLSTMTGARQEDGEGDGDSSPTLQFNAGIAASYYHFFLDRARNNVGLDGNLDLTINPQGRFVFRLYDNFGRTIRPFTDATPEGQAPNYARIQNSAGVDLTLQSRGQTLSGTLGYRLDLDFFEDNNFDYLNNLGHLVSLAFNWRFFPNTALVSRTEAGFRTYLDPPTGGGAGSLLTDSRRVSSWLGINGAITQRLSFTAMAGYTVGFFVDGQTDDYDNFLAHLELKYAPRGSLNFALGYRRDFRPTFVGNFVGSNNIYLKGQVLVGGSFMLGAQLAVSFDESGRALNPDGTALGNSATRSDTRLFATLFAEYRFTDWLALNGSLGFAGDYTDYEFNDPGMGSSAPDAPAGYNKFDAWLGLRVFY